jgi:hypothetical protein
VARERVRAVVVCEDRAHRSFAEKLCERLGLTPLHVHVAPSGAGSAEQWVRNRFLAEARAHRSQANHQANLVLLVVTDSDAFGVAGRTAWFDEELEKDGRPRRGGAERIVYLVPAWSIETWLAWLSGAEGDLAPFDEMRRFRREPAYQRLVESGAVSPKIAVERWTPARAEEAGVVPSLAAARRELNRLP